MRSHSIKQVARVLAWSYLVCVVVCRMSELFVGRLENRVRLRPLSLGALIRVKRRMLDPLDFSRAKHTCRQR